MQVALGLSKQLKEFGHCLGTLLSGICPDTDKLNDRFATLNMNQRTSGSIVRNGRTGNQYGSGMLDVCSMVL
jgi:hypothetical protein